MLNAFSLGDSMTGLKATLPAAVIGGVLVGTLALPAQAQMAIPDDAKSTCPVPAKEFAKWFAGDGPSKDGYVKPANSVGFPTKNTVCDFYKWGAQMFLWLTSPDGDGLVLNGPSIIDVTPARNGKRQMLPHDGEAPIPMALRHEKEDEIEEIGQAGSSGVLMSQDSSLVYYGVHVNDVYGYFLTGQKDGKFPNATKFPRNKSDLNDVVDYVKTAYPDRDLVEAKALAMELKTSWVEASSLSNPDDYVTMSGRIPTYNKSNPNKWVADGTKTTKLALTGMHVVGTVRNHPEFVWATFEHVDNAPDASYWYKDKSGKLKQQKFSSKGDYLFMETGAPEKPANVECMAASEGATGNIVAVDANQDPVTQGGKPACKGGIVPSNTVREYPWGRTTGKSSAENNTLLISNYVSVRDQLAKGDVRKKYVQTGSIWTSPSDPVDDAPIPNAFFRGSLKLANMTMETYTQGTNCFSCHQQSADAPDSFQAFQLSHIFSQIQPLPKE